VPRQTLTARVGAALLIGGALAVPATGQLPPPDLTPVVLACWPDARLYESFSAGTTDYCRSHLRYVPGALDCYRVIDEICSVYLPATGEWTEMRRPRARIPLACPEGPEPPVCRRLDLR
jgi:hypothetical protein